MKRVLVCLFSETGNTLKIGKAIREEAVTMGHVVSLETLPVPDPRSLANYDVVFVGSPCHASSLAQPVLDLLSTLPGDPPTQLAGFVTHATWEAGADSYKNGLFERWAGRCQPTFESMCASKGIRFLGFFNCMGAPNPGIEAFVHNTIIADEAQWDEYVTEARQHPTDQDVQNARAFARTILQSF